MAGYSIMAAAFSTTPTMSGVLSNSDFPSGVSYRLSDLAKTTPGVGHPCKLSDFGGKKRRFGDSHPYGYDIDNGYKGFDMAGAIEIIQGTDIANDNLYLDLMSLRAVITFHENDYGVIFESGGSGVGCALYIDSTTLYWQAGAGSLGGNIELSTDITGYSNGPREILVTTDFRGSTIAGTLSIDGTQVDSVDGTGNASWICGSDKGGSGEKYNSIAVLRNNQSSDFTGTIHSVRIYNA